MLRCDPIRARTHVCVCVCRCVRVCDQVWQLICQAIVGDTHFEGMPPTPTHTHLAWARINHYKSGYSFIHSLRHSFIQLFMPFKWLAVNGSVVERGRGVLKGISEIPPPPLRNSFDELPQHNAKINKFVQVYTCAIGHKRLRRRVRVGTT